LNVGRETRRGGARRLSGLELGLRMGAGMVLLVFGGYALDWVLGTSPWFLLAGAVMGGVVVIYDMIRRARRERGG
jgi:F0F1-type ATP synthase assembly protein I